MSRSFRERSNGLNEDGFFDPKDGQRGRLWPRKEFTRRREALAQGQTPWTKQSGSVVRGFRSKLDGNAPAVWDRLSGDLSTARGSEPTLVPRGRSENGD